MLPNESPATRYCYTCATAAGSLKLQLEVQDAKSGTAQEVNLDDLELQPLDEAGSSNSKSRGRIPQIAPSRSGARVAAARSGAKLSRPPTAVPNIAPGGRSSSRINVPVRPVASGADAAPVVPPTAASGSRNRISSPKFEIPQIAPRQEDFQPQDKSGFPAKLVIGLCASVLVVVLAVWMTKSSKPAAPTETQIALATPPVSAVPKTKIDETKISIPVVKALEKSDAKPVEKGTSTTDDPGVRIGLAGAGQTHSTITAPSPLIPPTPPNPDAPKPEPRAEPKADTPPAEGTNIGDIIKSKTKRFGEVEDDVVDPNAAPKNKKRPVTNNVPTIKKPAAADPVPGTRIEPQPGDSAAVKPETPPAPDKPDAEKNPDGDDDADGKPKKPKRSLLENLGGDAPKAAKLEPEKKEKENPFAIKIVPVTATEPTIMPLDIEKVGGTDRTLTDQLVVFLPNWRVRDANFATSKIGEKYLNRESVIALNPLNDILPAKLIATIEIPKNYASSRPTVLFEVGTGSGGKTPDWALGVKAMGVDVLQRTKIKLPKDAPWKEVVIDLSTLADKHFELQIEVYATTKHPKGTAPEIGYIRNVRFEWKKK